jgi:NHLM bacteriocin system ABC transporter peptidase/ATP-binding protein
VRTPTLLQMQAVDCGATSLGIVLAHHGRHVPLSELSRACGVSRDGSQALNIVKAARAYGLEARAFSVDLERLGDVPCPYIVFWNFNHFLVVEGLGPTRAYLNDPASGPRSVSRDEFSRAFTGVVLSLRPGPAFQTGGRRPRVLPALFERLRGSMTALAYCVLLGLMLVLPGVAVPVFSQVFVDNVLVLGMHDWLRPLVLGMVLAALLRGALSAWQLHGLRTLRLKLAVVLSSRFVWLVLRLPVGFYAQRYSGDIGSRVEINTQIASVLSGRLATTAIDVCTIGLYAAVMFYYDPLLASLGVASAALNLAALQWVSRRRRDANMRLATEQGKAQGLAIAGLHGIETLKASGLESDFFARWAGTYAKAVNAQQELGAASQALGVLPSFLSALSSALVLIVGGTRVMNGTFSIGMLVAFQSLMQSFQQPLISLLGLGATLQQLHGDLNRLDDVLVEEPDPAARDDGELAGGVPARLSGRVELRSLTFGYNRLGPPLIEGLGLTIEPGQRVAFVGPSGSGKSTVAKLVTGLYEPWSGDVLFDGGRRQEIPRPVLTTSMALVEQEIFLFEGSVRDNLTLWCSTVPDEELVRACTDACIHDDIVALAGGYDARLEEGGRNLSGGQRQRLEIARALVQNPSILVLDEATSALDAETERVIDRNLRRRGCSCLIIAHRLSTIRDCDEIVVLSAGKAIERGTHAALLARRAAYATLIGAEGEALTEAVAS